MTNSVNGRFETRTLAGLALGGIATAVALVAAPSPSGAVAADAGADGDKCYNSSQLYRCAGVTEFTESFYGDGYIHDYAHGRNYKVAVGNVRLQRWNYSSARWQTEKVESDYDGFHAVRDSASLRKGSACRGKWRTVATFSWHRVGRSKVKSMTRASRAVWCG